MKFWLKTQVTPSPSGPRAFCVAWQTHNGNAGVVNVEVVMSCEDAAIVAELYAIRHLIEDTAVLGLYQQKDFGLKVTHGAIRKLARSASAKEHLVKHASYVKTVLNGCQVAVDKKPIDEDAISSCDELIIDRPLPVLVEAPGCGKVRVTQHAVERICERLPASKSKTPWEQAHAVLTHSDQVRTWDRGKKAVSKRLKHIKHDYSKSFYLDNETLGVRVVVVQKGPFRSVATAYLLHSHQARVA